MYLKSFQHEDVMLDHALRTVCFICDIGDILVLMSRRLTTEMPDLNLDAGDTKSLSDILAEREKRTSKNICHIFHCDEVRIYLCVLQADRNAILAVLSIRVS